MAKVLEFKKSDADIGISIRMQAKGPEAVLLNEFVEQYADKLTSLKKHYALFFEPLVPTGYPDLVMVTYNPKKYKSWIKERAALSVLDLKVLHHLYFVKGSTSEVIENQLGLESKQLLQILEKLLDALLLKRSRNRWVPVSLQNSYGINNIKTIEAKISDWSGVLQQANMNRWFSSESCVLSPVLNPSTQVITKAKKSGIGIYSMSSSKIRIKIIQKPLRSTGLPVSYASWLFNEWIGRQLFRERSV